MKTPVIFVALFSFASVVQSQVPVTAIFLKKNAKVITDRLLRLSDFRTAPNSDSPVTAQTSSVIFPSVIEEKRLPGNKVMVVYNVLPLFVNLSFMQEKVKRDTDKVMLNRILKHEQDHYNLTIIASAMLKLALDKHKIYNVSSEQKEFSGILTPVISKYSQVNQLYEYEAHNGLNLEKQLVWNQMIDRALLSKSLTELQSYYETAVKHTSL